MHLNPRKRSSTDEGARVSRLAVEDLSHRIVDRDRDRLVVKDHHKVLSCRVTVSAHCPDGIFGKLRRDARLNHCAPRGERERRSAPPRSRRWLQTVKAASLFRHADKNGCDAAALPDFLAMR